MKKLVKDLKGGEILAEPVLKSEDEILIEKDTVLKQSYLNLLSEFEIEIVSIQDEFEVFEKPHLLMEQEKQDDYILKIRKILEGHIYRDIYHGNYSLQNVKELADMMIEDLPDMKEEIVFDINPHEASLYEHSFMVTAFSICVGKRLGLTKQTLLEMAQGCLLHDLGLRYITAPYKNFSIEEHSSAEIFELKKHTILGYSALESAEWLSDIAKRMVLSHHERIDGSGYPLKQKSKEIECQIIQVCDAFDCMISGMECERQNVYDAVENILNDNGSFEETVVSSFLGMIARYPVGTRLIQDGKAGIVIEQTKKSSEPRIGFIGNKDDNNKEKIV